MRERKWERRKEGNEVINKLKKKKRMRERKRDRRGEGNEVMGVDWNGGIWKQSCGGGREGEKMEGKRLEKIRVGEEEKKKGKK